MDSNPSHVQLPLAVLVLAVGVLYTAYVSRQNQAQSLPLPPGPHPDPLIGHLRKFPMSDENRVYAQWSKELNSDIISISVLGQSIIILNSARAANDLLERRSAIYSDRPQLPMTSFPDLVDWSKITGMLPYGERWRSQRRMTHGFLHKKANMQFWPIIVKQSRLALHRLLTSPEKYVREFRRMAGSTLLSAVYGYEVTSADDPLVKVLERTLDHFSEAAMPPNFMVNFLPELRHLPDWFPGTRWKQTVKEWRKERDEMIDTPFHWTKGQIANGMAPHSALKDMLARLESSSDSASDYSEEEDIVKWVAGTVYGAGADTSAATTSVFILAMVLHQGVLAKAQAEVDRVIGRDRLPEMSDRDSLPYIECVLREVLRWQPVAPFIPHSTIEEDEYRGYLIPKGAIVMGNIWAIGYDETVYPEPSRFNPDRFLDPKTPKPPSFGFGRRSCPGIHMAESTLFITIASVVSLFDIRPAKDKNGRDIIPLVEMKSNALVSYPAEFECSITPRSEKTAQLLGVVASEQHQS